MLGTEKIVIAHEPSISIGESLFDPNLMADREYTGTKSPRRWIHSGQRTLICVSVTSSGRLLTMILLSPVALAVSADARVGSLVSVLFFWTPPVGALMAALALDLAVRGTRGRRPRPVVGLPPSVMIWSRDWSSFPDMVSEFCGLLERAGVIVMAVSWT